MADPVPLGSIERRLALLLFTTMTALIMLFLLRDASSFVNSARDEVLGHAGAAAGFTLAATGTLVALRRRRPSLLTILVLGAAITALGELLQGFAPSRAIQLRDIGVGFGGVLIASVIIELLFERASLQRSLRTQMAGAVTASMILLSLLVFDLAPRNFLTAAPDGERCPLTLLTGEPSRIRIGEPRIVDGCFTTESGGFALYGPTGANALRDDTVLVSSPLGELAESILQTRTLSLRAEIVTGRFDETRRSSPSTIATLRSRGAGELLVVRTFNERVEIHGPNTTRRFRAVLLSPALAANQRHVIQADLTAESLRVFVDGELVGSAVVDADWAGPIGNAPRGPEVTLLVGNNTARELPVDGTLEWIEIESS